MKNLICFFVILWPNCICIGQLVLQDKIYIENGVYYTPFVDKRIASAKWGNVDAKESFESKSPYTLPIGVAKINNYRIRWCLISDRIFSVSFAERRGIFSSGPYFVAIDTSSLTKIAGGVVNEFVSVWNETLHTTTSLVLFNALPFKQALKKTNLKSINFDVSFNDNTNILLIYTLYNDSINLWNCKIMKDSFLKFTDSPEKIKAHEEYYIPKLVNNYKLEVGDNADFSVFCLNNKDYIFFHATGELYLVNKDKITFLKNIKNEVADYDEDNSIIINKDTNQLYIIPKVAFLEAERESFQEIVQRRATEITLD